MRSKETPTAEFRRLVKEIALLLGYEICRDLPLEDVEVETPLETTTVKMLAGKKLCLVSVLRAGNGLLEGMLDLIPSARVGHVGLYRDHATLQPVEYFYKVPSDIAERPVILVDPMLATANSAIAAVAKVKASGATDIKYACLLAAPEGVPQVPRRPPGRASVYRGRRSGVERQGLHHAGPRRCGRSDLRDEMTAE